MKTIRPHTTAFDLRMGRVPAQAIEIEQAVLNNFASYGAQAIDQVVGMIKSPDLFYKDDHKELFKVIMRLYRENRTIDINTLFVATAEKHDLRIALLDITSKSTNGNITSMKEYIMILLDKYIHRRAVMANYEMGQKLVDDDPHEAYMALEKAHTEVAEILNGKDKVRLLGDVIKTSLQKLDERIAINKSGKLPGIDTGFKKLNSMTAGWQKGDMVVIAGRPGMGKTAIALHFAQVAAADGVPVLMFSLEMADYRMADRLVIGESQVNSYAYAHGKLNSLDRDAVWAQSNNLAHLPIYIDEASGVDVEYITSLSRTMKRKNDVGMVIIDYLQLVDMKQKGGETRDQAIGNVTRKLKQLAKELEVPVMLLSQLNRALEARSSKEPTLADLRESGNIEQDADIVTLLYRPAYYDIPEYRGHPSDNMLWLNTEKHRNGNPEHIGVSHNQTLTRFTNYEPAI